MLNKILSKLAAEQPIDPAAAPQTEEMHEAAETPQMEAAEHAPGGYEEAGEGGGDELAQIEQLISQLSPEEVQQLIQELEGGGAGAGGDDTANLSQAIEGHLAETPEASVPEAPEEKQAALSFVKSASYIHGFLKYATDQGVDIHQAVDLYDSALSQAIHDLKVASLKGNQTKLDVDKDGKIEASDLAKLRAGKGKTVKKANVGDAFTAAGRALRGGLPDNVTETLQGLPQQGAEALRGVADKLDPGFLEQLKAQAGNAVSGAGNFMREHGIDPTIAAALGGGAALGAGGMGLYKHLTRPKQEEEMKMASYYDGLFERASEYGLSPDETIKLAGWWDTIKEKMPQRAGIPGAVGGPAPIPGRMPEGKPVTGGTAKAK
jgi:hypothetical protein